MRMPSSSSTSATTYRSSNHGNCGWRGSTALKTVPRPDDSTAVHASEWQCGHIGRGGCRSAPQPSQRWISSRCVAQAVPEELRVGGDRRAEALGQGGAHSASPSGLNFRMRNVWRPTVSPAASL